MLDKFRDGQLGFVHAAVGRRRITNLITGWIDDLSASASGAALAPDLREVRQHFEAYRRCEQSCPCNAAEDKAQPTQPTNGRAGTPPSPAASQGGEEEDAVESLKRSTTTTRSESSSISFTT